MSLYSDAFSVSLPYTDAFEAAKEGLSPLNADVRSNGFVLSGKTHQEVYYPVNMRIAVLDEGESTRFEMEGSNMGLGMMQKQILRDRFAQVRTAIEEACAKKKG